MDLDAIISMACDVADFLFRAIVVCLVIAASIVVGGGFIEMVNGWAP